jgi:signal transduction histidine kinase
VTNRHASILLAEALAAHREEAQQRLRRRLAARGSGLALDSTSLHECLADADEILSELIDTIRHGGRQPRPATIGTAERVGARQAAARLRPEGSLRASAHVFDVILELVACLGSDPSALVTHASHLGWIVTERLRVSSAYYSRFLLDEIVHAHTSERLRISRELHDRVSNDIGAAIRHLELYRTLDTTDPTLARQMLDRTGALLAHILDETRLLTSSLRLEVGEVTLTEAIERHLAETRPAPHHEVRITGETEAMMPDHLREELFLMIREAIRNVTAHAHASRVIVEIEFGADQVHVIVDDDGVGFADVPDANHHGIASMHERASLLNGTVEVTGRPGQGTRVALRVPVHIHVADASVH